MYLLEPAKTTIWFYRKTGCHKNAYLEWAGSYKKWEEEEKEEGEHEMDFNIVTEQRNQSESDIDQEWVHSK